MGDEGGGVRVGSHVEDLRNVDEVTALTRTSAFVPDAPQNVDAKARRKLSSKYF